MNTTTFFTTVGLMWWMCRSYTLGRKSGLIHSLPRQELAEGPSEESRAEVRPDRTAFLAVRVSTFSLSLTTKSSTNAAPDTLSPHSGPIGTSCAGPSCLSPRSRDTPSNDEPLHYELSYLFPSELADLHYRHKPAVLAAGNQWPGLC
jgi:hypothetical protein